MDDQAGQNSESFAEKYARQKQLLESQHQFPTDYLFKFIVPVDKEAEARALFPNTEPKTRPSKKGNYISLSFSYRVDSADLVLAIYEKASKIDGLIAL